MNLNYMKSNFCQEVNSMNAAKIIRLAAISTALFACIFGCNLFENNDDPWGCNDRKPLNYKDIVMPTANLQQAYSFDFSSTISQDITLLDTAKAAQYGFELNGRLFKGTPLKTTILDSFRIYGWENGTQCMGRSDTFTAYISIK